MPTYQYACTACGQHLEAVQSFTDAPLTECPACAGRLRKLFTSVGVVFKGSGFYRTDSRTAPKEAAAASGPAVDSKNGASAPAGADAGSSAKQAPSATDAPSAKGAPNGGSSHGSSASGSASSGRSAAKAKAAA